MPDEKSPPGGEFGIVPPGFGPPEKAPEPQTTPAAPEVARSVVPAPIRIEPLEKAAEPQSKQAEPAREAEYANDSGAADVAWVGLSFVWTVAKVAILTGVIGLTFWFSYIFGYTIYVSYFRIPEEVEVPVLEGVEVTQAYDALEEVGLQLQVHESRHSKDVPRETIIKQDPAPGRKVRKKRAVLVVVSLGPELIEVPDLQGKTIREAKIILSNSRLRLGNVSFKEAVQGKPEQVVHQRPGPGEMVRKGETINLQIQKGGGGAALIDVPNWNGNHVYRIAQLVGETDLNLGSIVWVFNDYVPKGEVMGQAPPGGGRVTPRSIVDFEVSAGPLKERAFKQRRLSIEVPAGSRSQRVAVVLNSDVGTDKVFEGSHLAGDEMELLVAGWPGSEIEVYINDKLQRREKL